MDPENGLCHSTIPIVSSHPHCSPLPPFCIISIPFASPSCLFSLRCSAQSFFIRAPPFSPRAPHSTPLHSIPFPCSALPLSVLPFGWGRSSLNPRSPFPHRSTRHARCRKALRGLRVPHASTRPAFLSVPRPPDVPVAAIPPPHPPFPLPRHHLCGAGPPPYAAASELRRAACGPFSARVPLDLPHCFQASRRRRRRFRTAPSALRGGWGGGVRFRPVFSTCFNKPCCVRGDTFFFLSHRTFYFPPCTAPLLLSRAPLPPLRPIRVRERPERVSAREHVRNEHDCRPF